MGRIVYKRNSGSEKDLENASRKQGNRVAYSNTVVDRTHRTKSRIEEVKRSQGQSVDIDAKSSGFHTCYVCMVFGYSRFSAGLSTS